MRKRYIITGCSGLLGRNLVQMYLQRNCEVLGIDKEISPELQEILMKEDDSLFDFHTFDVTIANDHRYSCLGDYFRSYDVLINCIGMSHLDWLQDYTYEDLLEIYQVNTLAPIMFDREFVRAHASDKDGVYTICNIISMGSRMAMRTSVGYCSTKAAMVMATRQISREVSGKYPQFRVFGINPCSFYSGDRDHIDGIIDDILPEMLRTRPNQFHNLEEAKKYNLQSPTGDWLHVDDLMKFIDFMVEYSNVHMNGSVLDFHDAGA